VQIKKYLEVTKDRHRGEIKNIVAQQKMGVAVKTKIS